MPPVGYAVALTSLVRVNDSGSATITLHELQDQSDIVLSGKRYPLTADYTAPLALLAERRDGQKRQQLRKDPESLLPWLKNTQTGIYGQQ